MMWISNLLVQGLGDSGKGAPQKRFSFTGPHQKDPSLPLEVKTLDVFCPSRYSHGRVLSMDHQHLEGINEGLSAKDGLPHDQQMSQLSASDHIGWTPPDLNIVNINTSGILAEL